MSYVQPSLDIFSGTPKVVIGKQNILFCAPATSLWFAEMSKMFPGQVYPSLYNAINALPANDGTDNFGSKIIVGPGTQTVTATTLPVVAKTNPGTTIEFLPGAILTTATNLTADIGVLEIQATDCTVINPFITNSAATQAGSGLIIGGATGTTEGTGARTKVIGGTIGGATTATDFAKPIQVRQAELTELRGVTVYGSTGTTNGIAIEAGVGNGYGHKIIDCNVKFITGGASTKPLTVAASQINGLISGGSFTTDSAATAIEITAEGWTLNGGGLAGNTDTVGAGAQIDLVTATTIYVGEFYVKDVDGATPASLFDQANV